MPHIPGEPLVLLQASSVKELEIYCLLSIGESGFEIQSHPLRKLQGAKWKRDLSSMDPMIWKFPWPGLAPATHVILTRQARCLILSDGRLLWTYKCNHPTRLFQDAWIPILHDQNPSLRFLKEDFPLEPLRRQAVYDNYYPIVYSSSPAEQPVRTQEPPLAPVRSASTGIPAHVFRVFVESAVRSQTACPISLDPLTLESAAGLPCGHLFEKESLKQALVQGGGRCPQCRRESSIDEIQIL